MVEQLKIGKAKEDTIYVFEHYPSWVVNTDLHIYGYEGYYIAVKNTLDNVEEFDEKDLTNEENFALYLEKIAKLNDCIILIAVRDEASYGLSPLQVEAMKRLGLMDFRDHFRESYICVIDDGQTIVQESGKEILSYEIQVDDTTFYLSSAGGEEAYMESIQCNGMECSAQNRGFNIVVYSKVMHTVIDSVAFDTYEKGDAVRKDN